MKKLSKEQNRMISVVSICVFIASFMLAGIFGVFYIRNYYVNLDLEQQNAIAQQEEEYVEDLKKSTDEDGNYVVYDDDDMVTYGGDTIILG